MRFFRRLKAFFILCYVFQIKWKAAWHLTKWEK